MGPENHERAGRMRFVFSPPLEMALFTSHVELWLGKMWVVHFLTAARVSFSA